VSTATTGTLLCQAEQ